ncbi:TonB family protein [Vampirovibrio sp.]|uniref:TonB family protein n=1 Tax=Vampirovibrio sp. TaxID=2717857 RepID=UPI0035938FD6
MSQPEKPVFKSPAQSGEAGQKGVKNGMAQKPEQAISTGMSPSISREALQARYRKGISLVGTEERLDALSMKRATGLSAVFHVLGPVALAVITLLVLLFLSWVMKFNVWDLFHSAKKPDMEFSLVKDTQATRPDDPKFRGNFNQRAGGKTNKRQPLKAVEEPPQSSAAQKSEPPKKQAEPVPPQQATPKTQQPQQKPPVQKPTADKTPVKSTGLPTIPKPAKTQEAASSSQAQKATAAASGSPSNPGSQASTGATFTGSGVAEASLGNPQEGKGTTPGVDVAEDADFGPFMADLEKRIKRNWSPPRGADSRKVVLMLFIARDGKVVKIEVKKSSGDPEADESAKQAVNASAPFMILPPQFREDILPVEFAFDYNVLNPKNPKQALKW